MVFRKYAKLEHTQDIVIDLKSIWRLMSVRQTVSFQDCQ